VAAIETRRGARVEPPNPKPPHISPGNADRVIGAFDGGEAGDPPGLPARGGCSRGIGEGRTTRRPTARGNCSGGRLPDARSRRGSRGSGSATSSCRFAPHSFSPLSYLRFGAVCCNGRGEKIEVVGAAHHFYNPWYLWLSHLVTMCCSV
jgi:hypothetical protein